MSSLTVSDHTVSQMRQDGHPEEVIRLQDVSVSYRLAFKKDGTLKEYVIHLLQGKMRVETFQALQYINLSINAGEVFGIIGRNGAGKSTLLKLVAGVLRRPTHGRVWVKGQVAPLLAVGAGFHPYLTGRENVFLNGALLGFNRRQIEEKFNRIVDFAELWDFIDAPLDTYSTGMVARLGFAIATDAQPDILLVDEILGVGDESFMQKCSQRIQSYRDNGATILLVTHNMATVQALCNRAAWISHGELKMVGNPEDVIAGYHHELERG